MKDRYILTLLIILGLHFLVHDYFVKYYTKAPLDTKVSLDSIGKISKVIEIRMPQKYDIRLVFNKKNHDYNMLIDLIRPISFPNKVPIQWSLTENKSKIVIYKDQIFPRKELSNSRDDISLTFGQFKVLPGLYTLDITVVENIPKLSNIDTSIKVTYKSKNGTTWHSAYIWLGAIFNYFISPVLIGVLSIILIIKNILRVKALKK